MKLEFISRVSMTFVDECSKRLWISENVSEHSDGRWIKMLCPLSGRTVLVELPDFSDEYDDGLLIFDIVTIGHTPRKWFAMTMQCIPTLDFGRLDFCCSDIFFSGEVQWNRENKTLAGDFRIGEELDSSGHYDDVFNRCSLCTRIICDCD
jgi:hypothetical protein